VPCAPNRYNYPALVPAELHERCLWDTEAELVEKLARLLTGPMPNREVLREAARRFEWEQVVGHWDGALEGLTRRTQG